MCGSIIGWLAPIWRPDAVALVAVRPALPARGGRPLGSTVVSGAARIIEGALDELQRRGAVNRASV